MCSKETAGLVCRHLWLKNLLEKNKQGAQRGDMEVVVTEEKKKIFRARKTMKISDRQQLDSLHTTLLTAAPGLSNPSPPPIMNGTHKEDGQKSGEKEQNNISGSNSPRAPSPSSLTSLSSPAPYLSLNLSPSPPSSHSPKAQEETSPPSSPFLSLNFEPNQDGEENECLPSSSKDSKPSSNDTEMEVDSVKVEPKKLKDESTRKPSRPSSTPPSNTGLKRTLSEGYEKDEPSVKKEGKKMKMDQQDELEAQLEVKITAKAGSHPKLEKIVQQLVEERMRVFELTIFDKHFQELKDRVDKIDCATKHQAAISTLQAKIARLSKKFGEANQASENKRKQEALAAAAAAAAANAAKTATVASNPPTQRYVCDCFYILYSSPALAATAAASTSTTSAVVSQTPILQLITSTSNAASNLAAGINTQSPAGTLLLKTASGSSMMTTGQPLLIQLPGALVNIPVSSLSAANSLNKAKTTASTTTFILKPAPATTTASAPAISLARAVYQGGTGAVNTPNAGVSVTTARTPAQSVSAVGAMSAASSPAASGPAATGSTAPGPPQGTSLTSKTDNQATGASSSKAATPTARPKGSVIDLTEDDDDVQVTGVKNATVPTPSPILRPNTVVSIPNSKTFIFVTLPPLPIAPVLSRLPPEAERTSPPQQPQLKLVPSQTGIVLSWCVAETDRTCATVDSYHLYAYHQDNSSGNAAQQHWKKIGEVKALPLPMACTLTQFQSGSTYHFAVRAKDIYGRFGAFCEPQCTNVINSSSS
uniref:Activating transcription factor 7 interacting protein n=1 Tax=Salarias fasciatus TaxID=181472 RepID=A0A672F615_SALFA